MESIHKRRIDNLLNGIRNLRMECFSEMDRRIATLGLIEKCNVLRESIEKYIEQMGTTLLIDIDVDFSYSEIVNDERWNVLEPSVHEGNNAVEPLFVKNTDRSSYSVLENCLTSKAYLSDTYSELFEWLNEKDKKVYQNNIDAIDASKDDSFRKELQKYELPLSVSVIDEDFYSLEMALGSEKKLSLNALEYILRHSMSRLRHSIRELGNIMDEHPTREKCEGLFMKFKGISSMMEKKEAMDNHTSWCEEHLEDDGKTVKYNCLLDRQAELILEMAGLPCMKKLKSKVANKDFKAWADDIEFEVYTEEEMQQAKLGYRCFLALFDRVCITEEEDEQKVILFSPNKHHIGEFMYVNRKFFRAEERKKFLVMMYEFYIVNSKIGRRNTEVVEEAEIDDSLYANVTCSLTDEKIASSGIKENAKLVLAYIENAKEQIGGKKILWMSFYVVLLELKWIDENVKAFCDSMNSLFEAGLDNTSCSRDLKEKTTDYLSWSDDPRVKKRKEVAEGFKAYLDGYIRLEEQKRKKKLQEFINP